MLLATPAQAASPHLDGRWLAPFKMRDSLRVPSDPGEIAVHMALLRGRADSGQVLLWNHGYSAHILLNAVAGANAPIRWVPSGDPADPLYLENFCGGHSTLRSGELFVAGGVFNTGAPPTGVTYSGTFDATRYASSGSGWTRRDNMPSGRYYPTCTTLGDGTVLTTQGDEFFQLATYGGTGGDGAVRNTVHPLGLAQAPVWTEGTVLLDTGVQQRYRTGHTANYIEGNVEVALFGGRDQAGVVQDNPQFLYREDPTDSTQRWVLYENQIFGPVQPARRAEHAAASVTDGMIMFGGVGFDGLALPSEQALFKLGFSKPDYFWERILPSGPAPNLRWGHTAVFDPGTETGTPYVIVFGGRNESGFTDNSVWGLRLLDPPVWVQLAPANPDPNQAPSARKGQVAIFDPGVRGGKRQMVIFGGEDASGALKNDAWVLERSENGTSFAWRKLNAQLPPVPLTGAAAVYDPQREMLLVMGGDANGSSGGGQVDSLWGLPLRNSGVGGNPVWQRFSATGSNALGTRSGHAAAYVGLPSSSNRRPDRFIPGAPTGSQWRTASKGLQWKLMPLTYPFLFTLPSGNVFWAGPNGLCTQGCPWSPYNLADSTYLYVTDTTSAKPGWKRPGIHSKGFWGGSAVLFHAGTDSAKIMKCGGNHGLGFHAGAPDDSTGTYVVAFDANDNTTGWRQHATTPGSVLAHRRDHNLVVLPTGKVLVVGGAGRNTGAKPQLWDPVTRSWTPELDAPEPASRNYHSSAVLLPDGRVLSAGGNPDMDGTDAHTGCLYEPAYLFDPDGSAADQPPVTGSPDSAMWGNVITLCTPNAATIKSACLIRPGAATHAFNQDQRFLPLTFAKAASPWRLLITMPANGNIAPPGDYLLFMVDSTAAGGREIPSVAEWVRLGASGPDLCDVVAPATVSDLGSTPCTGGVDNQYLLQWTAPADDGSLAASGRAASYDFRQYGAPITDANWNLAEPIGGFTPSGPGSTESMVVTITNLTYIRMKTRDDGDGQGNWSGLSNQVVLHPVVCGEGGMFAGGGGGGSGFALQRSAATTSARASALSYAAAAENSLLNGVPAGIRGRDYFRLGALNVASDGTCAVRVREGQDHAAALDAARLLTVDHAADVTAYALGEAIVLGTRQSATRVTAPDGSDLTATFDSGSTYTISSGDTLSVDLGPGGAGSPLIVAARGWGALECLVPDGAGGWRAGQSGYPRTAPDEMALPAPGADLVRLVSLGSATISFVGRLVAGAETPTVEEATLVSSTSSRNGDVRALVAAQDTATATLVGPDTLSLEFALTPPAQGLERDYFLVVDATPQSPGAVAPSNLHQGHAALPAQFALRQIRPNPFARTTNIHFELPVGAMVRLDLFDAQGRRLATLANRYYPPGFHAVSWTPAASAGKLGPGLYFCRMEAGSFRDRQKVTLLP